MEDLASEVRTLSIQSESPRPENATTKSTTNSTHWYYGWPTTLKWLAEYHAQHNLPVPFHPVTAIASIERASGSGYLTFAIVSRAGYEDQLPLHDVPRMAAIPGTIMLSIKSTRNRNAVIPQEVLQKLNTIFGEGPGWLPDALNQRELH